MPSRVAPVLCLVPEGFQKEINLLEPAALGTLAYEIAQERAFRKVLEWWNRSARVVGEARKGTLAIQWRRAPWEVFEREYWEFPVVERVFTLLERGGGSRSVFFSFRQERARISYPEDGSEPARERVQCERVSVHVKAEVSAKAANAATGQGIA